LFVVVYNTSEEDTYHFLESVREREREEEEERERRRGDDATHQKEREEKTHGGQKHFLIHSGSEHFSDNDDEGAAKNAYANY
jgi:hypothetical protein